MAIYYRNLETGFTYSRNGDRLFFSASVPKAILALYIFDLAEQGMLDLDSTVTVQASDFFQPFGWIEHRRNVGTPISQRTLSGWMVSYSCSMATSMLWRSHNWVNYRQFLLDLGILPANASGQLLHNRFTANDAGLYAEAIFNYIESDGTYSSTFREIFFNNQYQFVSSDYPTGSKTGWTSGLAWHDMAIIDAPSPFILVILTQRQGWSERDYRDFEEITRTFQNFNNTWFVS
jgi:beta-lactamase class A